MYAGAIVFTALLPRYQLETSGPRQSILTDLGGGIRYLRDNTVILSLLLFGVILMMLAMPLRFVLPVFAKDVFGVGAEGLGALMSSIGIGSLVGSLGIASLQRIGSRGMLLVVAGGLMTLAVLMFASVSHWIPLLSLGVICMAAIGLTMAIQLAVHQSLLMEYVEGGFRGRVMSFQGLGFSVMPGVVLPLTFGMEWIGAPLALAVMVLILFALGLTVLLLSPRLRRLA
jgi:MFS family permease